MKKYGAMLFCLAILAGGAAQNAFAKENEQWQLLEENAAGEYYSDVTAFRRVEKKENAIQARARIDLKDPGFIRLLTHHFGRKLTKDDKPAACLLTVVLHLEDHTYRIENIQLLSQEGKTLEKKALKEDYKPIPKGTFLENLEKEVQAWDILGKGTIQRETKRI